MINEVKLLHDCVLLEPLVRGTTIDNITIPRVAEPTHGYGQVCYLGPDAVDKNIELGDVVLYSGKCAVDVKINTQNLLMVTASQILMVVR